MDKLINFVHEHFEAVFGILIVGIVLVVIGSIAAVMLTNTTDSKDLENSQEKPLNTQNN